MNGKDFRVPDEYELIDFFGSEPIKRAAEDGYWCYEATAAAGATLRFSINLLERSVQTTIRIGAATIATISHESATKLDVEGKQLRGEFLAPDCRTTLTVDGARHFEVTWSTLRTR